MEQQAIPWKTVWITGASPGIGRQLAFDLTGLGQELSGAIRTTMAKQPLRLTDTMTRTGLSGCHPLAAPAEEQS